MLITEKQTEQEVKQILKNKIKISESEASECQYWLEIILEIKWIKPENMKIELTEVGELLAIFTSIGNNLKL